jgi:Pvc16 N-terminal domain
VQRRPPLRMPPTTLRRARVRASLNAMIADVDASLRSLLRATALHGSNVDVVFDSPTQQWSQHLAGSVVDAYLWEVREDVSRRQNDWEDVRNDAGRVVGRRSPLHRYRLRYLLTAWGGTIADEHRLLSSVLSSLADEQAIPADHVSGALAEEGLPVFVTVALPAEGDNPPWDLWGALGVAPRPALDLVVIAPLPRAAPAVGAAPVRDRRISVVAPGETPELVPSGIADQQRREALGEPVATAPAATRVVRRRS